MRQIFVEFSFKSFEDFHDGSWYENLFALCNGLEIEKEIGDFSFHWWGASRAFVLPWLLVSGVYDASNGARTEIRDKQKLWEEYIKYDSFKGAIWKTAESAYCSIYYGYENLVVNSINKIRKKSCRVTDRNFNSEVSECFGKSIASKIWKNSFIAVSKEVRNCLVHRGGKVSPALIKMKPLPKIENENILISASDVRALHGKLKKNVEILVYECIKKKNQLTRQSSRSLCSLGRLLQC